MHLFRCGRLGAGHLPVVLAIVFTATLGFTYCYSVFRGDVDPVFPYISASGDNRPESCIFSAMLNVCAFFSLIVLYLRYCLVRELNRSSDSLLKTANKFSFYVGLLGGLGMFIVANFQETAVIQIHLTGAFMCFGFGCIYTLCQSWMTFRMHPLFCNRRIAWIRLAMASTASVLFFVAFGFGFYAAYTFHQAHPDLPTPRPWNHKFHPMPGYTYHCISALAEWTLAVLHIAFFLSYSREFEKIRVGMSIQPLVAHLDDSPNLSDSDGESI